MVSKKRERSDLPTSKSPEVSARFSSAAALSAAEGSRIRSESNFN